MPDSNHEHQQDLVLDGIDNPVVAHAHPVQVLLTLQTLDTRGAGIVGQGVDLRFDSLLNLRGKRLQVTHGRRLELDPVLATRHLQRKVRLDLLPRDGPFFLQRLARGLHVQAVLDRLQ